MPFLPLSLPKTIPPHRLRSWREALLRIRLAGGGDPMQLERTLRLIEARLAASQVPAANVGGKTVA